MRIRSGIVPNHIILFEKHIINLDSILVAVPINQSTLRGHPEVAIVLRECKIRNRLVTQPYRKFDCDSVTASCEHGNLPESHSPQTSQRALSTGSRHRSNPA